MTAHNGFRQVNCYARNGAVEFQASQLNIKGGLRPTVNIELANKKQPTDTQYNWDHKLVFQLTDQELPLLCGVFLGYLPEVTIKRPNKGVTLTRQAGRVFTNASEASQRVAVPIGINDVFRASALCLEQLQEQSGLCDGQMVIAALRGATSLYRIPREKTPQT